MYTYIMNRTQIYLNDEEARALEREARATGRTKSRLIRDAIDRVYLGGRDASELLRSLEESAGAWRRREDGAAYVERMRSGRLARLHSE
jgi:predicted transcriptional regulator